MSEEQRSAQRYLEDLTPGGSEYANNPKRCYEWAIGRIESAHRIAMEAALERNAFRARVAELEAERERLRAALETIRRDYGKVCSGFDLCDHPACVSSAGAWFEADRALGGVTAGVREAAGDGGAREGTC